MSSPKVHRAPLKYCFECKSLLAETCLFLYFMLNVYCLLLIAWHKKQRRTVHSSQIGVLLKTIFRAGNLIGLSEGRTV